MVKPVDKSITTDDEREALRSGATFLPLFDRALKEEIDRQGGPDFMQREAGPSYPCLYCDAPLRFGMSQGWIHPGGGLYLMACKSCGQKTDESHEALKARGFRCPCGGELIDDHCATPRRSWSQTL